MGSKMIKNGFHNILFKKPPPYPFPVRCYSLDNITKLDQRNVYYSERLIFKFKT